MDLKEWTINYVKHKFLFKRGALKETNDGVYAEFNQRYFYAILPYLEGIETILETYRKTKLNYDIDMFVIVCFNTRKNFNVLVGNWNRLIGYHDISFIFVNPNSHSEQKWQISPHFHSKISEKNTLTQGLDTLFKNVEEIT